MSGGPPIVAIDGPAGVGKSTAARLLAARLGVPYFDTGATYRAIGLEVLAAGVDPADEAAVVALASAADLRLGERADGGLEVLLGGRPVAERIRTPEVSEVTSRISAYPGVRRRLVALQRETAGRLGGVVEGRDIGTRVFPDARHKFFLTARPEVRVGRRHEQLRAAGEEVDLAAVRAEVERRDQRDSRRAESPLTCDPSYTLVDTSDLTAEEVVARMLAAMGQG